MQVTHYGAAGKPIRRPFWMVRVDVTKRGEDARWFLELKEEIAGRCRGSEPSNPQLVRLMMEQYVPRH